MSDTLNDFPSWEYESKQGTVIGVVALFIVLAIATVALRFKCRLMARVKMSYDDWLLLSALPIAIAEGICVAYATKYGLGKHMKLLSNQDLLEVSKMAVAIQILWIIASGLIKLSILAFYLRIFGILKYVRLSAWSLIVLDLVWLVSVTISHGLECIPVAKTWDDSIPGHCLDTVALFMIGSIVDVVLDFLILILPLPAMIGLQMGLSKKISLIVILAVGSLYVHHINIYLIAYASASDMRPKPDPLPRGQKRDIRSDRLNMEWLASLGLVIGRAMLGHCLRMPPNVATYDASSEETGEESVINSDLGHSHGEKGFNINTAVMEQQGRAPESRSRSP